MQPRTQWTHSEVWSRLATTPERSFTIGDQQNKKKCWNRDRTAICDATCCIDAGRGVIRHWSCSDGSDGGRPLRNSHSARTEYIFADGCSKDNQESTYFMIFWKSWKWPSYRSKGLPYCIRWHQVIEMSSLTVETKWMERSTTDDGCSDTVEVMTSGAWVSILIIRMYPWVARESKIQWLPATFHIAGWMEQCHVLYGCFKAIPVLDYVDVEKAFGYPAQCYHVVQCHVWS